MIRTVVESILITNPDLIQLGSDRCSLRGVANIEHSKLLEEVPDITAEEGASVERLVESYFRNHKLEPGKAYHRVTVIIKGND